MNKLLCFTVFVLYFSSFGMNEYNICNDKAAVLRVVKTINNPDFMSGARDVFMDEINACTDLESDGTIGRPFFAYCIYYKCYQNVQDVQEFVKLIRDLKAKGIKIGAKRNDSIVQYYGISKEEMIKVMMKEMMKVMMKEVMKEVMKEMMKEMMKVIVNAIVNFSFEGITMFLEKASLDDSFDFNQSIDVDQQYNYTLLGLYISTLKNRMGYIDEYDEYDASNFGGVLISASKGQMNEKTYIGDCYIRKNDPRIIDLVLCAIGADRAGLAFSLLEQFFLNGYLDDKFAENGRIENQAFCCYLDVFFNDSYSRIISDTDRCVMHTQFYKSLQFVHRQPTNNIASIMEHVVFLADYYRLGHSLLVYSFPEQILFANNTFSCITANGIKKYTPLTFFLVYVPKKGDIEFFGKELERKNRYFENNPFKISRFNGVFMQFLSLMRYSRKESIGFWKVFDYLIEKNDQYNLVYQCYKHLYSDIKQHEAKIRPQIIGESITCIEIMKVMLSYQESCETCADIKRKNLLLGCIDKK